MKQEIVLETTVFGTLKFDGKEGLMEDYPIILGEKEITTTLYILEDFITEQNHANVLAFLESIPALYQKARSEIESSYKTNAFIRFFIQDQIENLDEDMLLDYFDVEEISQVTPERFIKRLEPRTIRIAPIGESGDKIDCTFDFSIDEEISDELLVILFNQSMEIYDITHES